MTSNPKSWKVGIAVAEFNEEITAALLKCCEDELLKSGVQKKNIRVIWTPGAYELPFVARQIALKKKVDAVICLGCVIKGQTSHDIFVAGWAALGIGQVSLETGVPTLFGVLTPKNLAQAKERSRPGSLNRGKEAAAAALRMIALKKKGV